MTSARKERNHAEGTGLLSDFYWQMEGKRICGQEEVWANSKVLAGMGELLLELGRDRLQGDEGLTKPLGFVI